MTSVCYFIVFVNLLYSSDQGISPTRYELNRGLKLFVNSINAKNEDEYLAKMISPYWNLTYDEQLDRKQNKCIEVLENIVKYSGNLTNLITYKLFQIVPSPVTTAYRTWDKFFIARGVDGNPKTVGCIFGSRSIGKVFSIHPTKIVTVKEIHKRVAQVYEDFVRLSHLPTCFENNDGGHWRTLFVRSNEAGDVMAAVTVNPLNYRLRFIWKQQLVLKEYFLKHLPNITLYHQVCSNTRCSHKEYPFVLLYGEKYLNETLNGLKFKISADSDFPINKFATEVLYDTIIRTAKLKPSTTVLDLCSSRGTFSIVVSNFVKKVVCFDVEEQKLTDAIYNAKFNNIRNVNFLLGKVNKQLNSVLESLNESSEIVAILTYIIAYREFAVIETIRSTVQISKVVYIGHKHYVGKTTKILIELCSYNNSTAPPFRLTKVIPVDILPQTVYFNTILILEREPVGNI